MRLSPCCLHADNALHNHHPIGETYMLYHHASCLCKSYAMQRGKIVYVLSMIPPSINCSALMYSWLGGSPPLLSNQEHVLQSLLQSSQGVEAMKPQCTLGSTPSKPGRRSEGNIFSCACIAMSKHFGLFCSVLHVFPITQCHLREIVIM